MVESLLNMQTISEVWIRAGLWSLWGKFLVMCLEHFKHKSTLLSVS